MLVVLFYVLFICLLGFGIYKIAVKALKKVDTEERMGTITDSKDLYDKVTTFTKLHGKKDYNGRINKFAKGD